MSGTGLSWDGYIAHLVSEWGSLAAVAEQVSMRRQFSEQIDSVERGLRRLRGRGHQGGGVWGQRLLLLFGLPSEVNDRIRWMGQYHTRFSDLPVPLGRELLAPWDRPPVSEGPTRIWLHLGHVSLALRSSQPDRARAHIQQARRAAGPQTEDAARIELALVQAYILSKTDRTRTDALLAEAQALLETASLSEADRACLHARLVDHRAYRHNKGDGTPRDPAQAEAMYASLPDHGPPFARCRRANGLGWSRLLQGDREQALHHGWCSVRYAGDGGSLRLRAMALNLIAAAAAGTPEGDHARDRALAIADRLRDEALVLRFSRHRPTKKRA